ncbi:hypothetical protein F1559_003696 [Cyanidiococcus yangmingshanensis]|uniref:GLTSCR protein conserved domain-containing protein n=1 Tax=Cyanidiococcus yangmingshanensis TaxID=2690220 RepID=A0A7J7IP88_9RHOD|nr:hypothetical protein F1559_003696 [Cyanidiococcus yangmingshanensis]
MFTHKDVTMGSGRSPASAFVGGLKRSESSLVPEEATEEACDLVGIAGSQADVGGILRGAALASTERLKAELQPLEDCLRRREQQLAAVTLALRAKRNGSTGGCGATLEELDSARKKLEIELFRLRQATLELQQRIGSTTDRGKASLEELDKALGIKEVVDSRDSLKSSEEDTQRAQLHKQFQESLTLGAVLTALQRLRREEAEERISETRAAVRRAVSAGNALSTLFQVASQQGLEETALECSASELRDTKPADLSQLPQCKLLVPGTELSQKRRRLEMAPTRDYMKVLQPDAQTPFSNKVDAWQRLEPYHVFFGELGPKVHKMTSCGSTTPQIDESAQTRLERFMARARDRFTKICARFDAIASVQELVIESGRLHHVKRFEAPL